LTTGIFISLSAVVPEIDVAIQSAEETETTDAMGGFFEMMAGMKAGAGPGSDGVWA